MTLTLAPWLSLLAIASLKGSIILIAALLAVRAMRRASAEARHAVLAIGLVAFMAVPVAGIVTPAWFRVELPRVPVEWSAGDASASPTAPGRDVPAASMPGDSRMANAAAGSPASLGGDIGGLKVADGGDASTFRSEAAPVGRDVPSIASMLVMIWLAGVALIALRLLVGVARLHILSTRATMVTDGAWLQTAHAIARQLGLTRGVTLLRGDREAVPMTWGVLSPVVWLPPAADRWPAALRSSVLSHELAHVRRRDAVTQWLANVAVALHWFNPLVWLATRALRAERERACDDAVLALGAAPDDYAAHLLDMVRALGASSGPAPAMAMARRSQFEGRLLAILDRACSRAPVGTARLVVAGAGAIILVLILGGLRSSAAAGSTAAVAAVAADPVPGTPRDARVPAPRNAAPPAGAYSTRSLQDPVRSAPTPIIAQRPAAPVSPAPARVPAAVPGSVAPEPPAHVVSSVPGATAPEAPAYASPAATAAGMRSGAAPSAETAPVAHVPTLPGDGALDVRAAGNPLPLSRSDTALLLEVITAAEGISGSTDRTMVLERVATIRNLAPVVVTALGRAASRVTSTSSRAGLLKTIIKHQPHAVGESRRAILDAISGEMNSTDVGSVFEVFIMRDSLDEAALADLFAQVGKMTSSSEKARVLIVAARKQKPEGTARAAYLKAASTIAGGNDRARALSALLDEPPAR